MCKSYLIKGKYIAEISSDAFELLFDDHECFSATYKGDQAYISGPGICPGTTLTCKDVVSLANLITSETQIDYDAALNLAELLFYSVDYIEAVIM